MVWVPDTGMLGRLTHFLFTALKNRNAYWKFLQEGNRASLLRKSKCLARDLVLKLDKALRTYESMGCSEFVNLRRIDLDRIQHRSAAEFIALEYDDFLYGFDPASNRLLYLFLKDDELSIRPLDIQSINSISSFPNISRVQVSRREVEHTGDAASLSDLTSLFLTCDQVESVASSLSFVNDTVNFEHLFAKGRYPNCALEFPHVLESRITSIEQNPNNICFALSSVTDVRNSTCKVFSPLLMLSNALDIQGSFRSIKSWIERKEPLLSLLCSIEYPAGEAYAKVLAAEKIDNYTYNPSNRRSKLRKRFGRLVNYYSYFSA